MRHLRRWLDQAPTRPQLKLWHNNDVMFFYPVSIQGGFDRGDPHLSILQFEISAVHIIYALLGGFIVLVCRQTSFSHFRAALMSRSASLACFHFFCESGQVYPLRHGSGIVFTPSIPQLYVGEAIWAFIFGIIIGMPFIQLPLMLSPTMHPPRGFHRPIRCQCIQPTRMGRSRRREHEYHRS